MTGDAEFMGLPVASEPPDERRFWKKLKRVFARVPFAEDLVAAYYCAIDPETPGYVRAVLLGAIAYFVLPIDMVPDILAGLGFTDDASVLAAAVAAVGRHLQPQHRARAKSALKHISS
ncbi:MAG: YkvA family protein [Alphaproteobacteria bacterium]|nr:YkvA family protein [Alphaproteobacteria bacterium]